MVNHRSIIIVLVFLMVTTTVLLSSLNVKRKREASQTVLVEQKDEKARFDGLSYYVLKNGKKELSLDAKDLNIINNEDLYFTEPKGIIYDQQESIRYQADKGEFINESKELKLTGHVKAKTPHARHESDVLYYNGNKRYLEAKGNVDSKYQDKKTLDQIKVSSNYLNSWLDDQRTLFLGNVEGTVNRKRVYEESFDFKANRMELNQLKSQLSLSENVILNRKNYHLSAQKAEIFLENFNKKLKYYVLYDDIELEEKLKMPDGSTQIRRAYSEKLEGYMAEAKVVLSGAPRVEQGEDLIKGYQITLRENVELVEVDDSQSSFDIKKER